MKHTLSCHLAAASILCAISNLGFADPVSIKPGDTIQKQIDAQKGKKVTIRLSSGEELTGIVKGTTNELVHLNELAGKEFFDAVIDVSKISAVIIRTK